VFKYKYKYTLDGASSNTDLSEVSYKSVWIYTAVPAVAAVIAALFMVMTKNFH